jgi:hypothetical protein
MSTHDQNFANLFMVVIGILIAITFVLIGLARFVGNSTQLQWAKQDPETLAAVASRIAPAGQVATPGSEPAGETPPAGAAEAAAAPVATKMTGLQRRLLRLPRGRRGRRPQVRGRRPVGAPHRQGQGHPEEAFHRRFPG